ncbi:MAG: sel1 repeat family protein [Campylobacterales bacterium]|nr:sel1 repeat family protein [Campylobacterales bacterium]
MNQTQKRLSIINLAISITDIETIQLQLSKLRLLRADPRIRKIIDALESESYAQAQIMIQEYIDNPVQEVHQRIPEGETKPTYTKRERDLIKQFDLFISEGSGEKEREIVDIDQYLQSSPLSSRTDAKPDLDKLLEMDEQASRKRDEHISCQEDLLLTTENSPAETPLQKTDQHNEDLLKEEEERTIPDEIPGREHIEARTQEEEQTPEAETDTLSQNEAGLSGAQGFSDKTNSAPENDTRYRPIFSIEQQFHDLAQKYPLLVRSAHPFESVKQWIEQVRDEHGYTKNDVENIVMKALKLAEEDSPSLRAEAAELLLLSGLTEDEFGQLILAREFFKGRFLERNISEAFRRIEYLATREYPEAICDLAQFYEHGIGTGKNKKKAKALYQKAMHLGIKRAAMHFERLNKGGLFSL